MKTNQLKLPFGQRAKQTKSVKTRTGSSPIRLSELKAHGITTATALSAEAILELGKRYDEKLTSSTELFTILAMSTPPSRMKWLGSRYYLQCHCRQHEEHGHHNKALPLYAYSNTNYALGR